MEEEGKLNPEPQQIKRVINLSHIRSGGASSSASGKMQNQEITSVATISTVRVFIIIELFIWVIIYIWTIKEIDSSMKPDTNSRVINLSHLKRTTGLFVVLNPPTTDLDESGSYEEEEGEDETSAPETVPSRIRPNSSFLKRFVGGVERSNGQKPIVCVQTADSFFC
jgi:hypothetical protein